MESTLKANPIKDFVSYWSVPLPCYRIAFVRISVCLVALISIFFNAGDWLILFTDSSGSPQLNVQATSILLGDSAMFRVSPLYWIESAFIWWLTIGLLCISLSLQLLGIGGRVVAATSALLWLSLVNRICLVQSLGDVLITMGLFYLVIDTGKINAAFLPGLFDRKNSAGGKQKQSDDRYTVSVALRLCQMSLAIWMLACFCSHLAGIIWWNGEAAWFITAAGTSIFEPQSLADGYWFGATLSHALVLSCGIASIGFLTCRFRHLSILAALGYWGSVYILTQDSVYALAGVALTISFAVKDR